MKVLILGKDDEVLCTLTGPWESGRIAKTWSAPIVRDGEAAHYELRSADDELVLRGRIDGCPAPVGRPPKNRMRFGSLRMYHGADFHLNYFDTRVAR